MRKRKWQALAAAVILPALMISGLAAQKKAGHEGHGDEEKTFPYDNGPDTIDVSTYPTEHQANYKIFVKKCAKCHTLARPINAPYSSSKEWGDYIEKMKKKKRSGLDAKSADKILKFLIYDSSVRKKGAPEKKAESAEKAESEKKAQ